MEQVQETPQATPQIPSIPAIPEIKKRSPLITIVLILMFLIIGSGLVYAGMKIQEKKTTPTPSAKITPSQNIPTAIPTTDPTVGWRTYTNENEKLSFRYPSIWTEKPILIRGSGFSQEFKDSEGKFIFTFDVQGNYSQITGKPFKTIGEFINLPYEVKKVTVGGMEGRQPLPRAGSENINSVYFFSKDLKNIYNLALQTGESSLNTAETDIVEGQKLFDQILSTFKFTQ